MFVAFRMPALAVNQAEPLGMIVKMLIGRHQCEKRMNKALVNHLAALFFAQPRGAAVRTVAGRPVAVKGRKPERIAQLERRPFSHVQRADGQVRIPRDPRRPGRPPSHAALFLQETVDRIECPSRPPPREQQAAVLRAHRQLLAAERRQIDLGEQPAGYGPGPYDDGGPGGAARTVPHLERSPRDLLQERRQFTCRVSLGDGGPRLRHNDARSPAPG